MAFGAAGAFALGAAGAFAAGRFTVAPGRGVVPWGVYITWRRGGART
jgi:hypothetical protein